jgi:CRP-like cAMP-binding protein
MAFDEDPDRMTMQELSAVPIFNGLESEELQLLTKCFHDEMYPEESLVFQQGQRAEKLHILLSGKVDIRFKPYDSEALTVASLSAGDVFGWSAALGRHDYTSDAYVTEEGHGLSIRGDVLREFCETHPRGGIILLERLAEVISSRLRQTHGKVVQLLQEGIKNNKPLPKNLEDSHGG